MIVGLNNNNISHEYEALVVNKQFRRNFVNNMVDVRMNNFMDNKGHGVNE